MSGTASSLLPLRIRLPYTTEEEFIDKYGSNVARGGVFVATRAMKPEGTGLAFEFVLADGTRLLRGEGVVVKSQVDATGGRTGMTVRFVKLDAASKALIDRVVARRTGSVEPQAPAQVVPPPPATTPALTPPPGLIRRAPGAKNSSSVRAATSSPAPSREEAHVEGASATVPTAVADSGAALANAAAVPEAAPIATTEREEEARSEVADSKSTAPASEPEQAPKAPVASTHTDAVSGESGAGALYEQTAFSDSSATGPQDSDAPDAEERPSVATPRFDADSSDGLDFAITASLAASENDGADSERAPHSPDEAANEASAPEDASTETGIAPATASTTSAADAPTSGEPVAEPQPPQPPPESVAQADTDSGARNATETPATSNEPAQVDSASAEPSTEPTLKTGPLAPASDAGTEPSLKAFSPATVPPSTADSVTGAPSANDAATNAESTDAAPGPEAAAIAAATHPDRIPAAGEAAPTESASTAAASTAEHVPDASNASARSEPKPEVTADGSSPAETPAAASATSEAPRTGAASASSETAVLPSEPPNAEAGDASTTRSPATAASLSDALDAEAVNAAATESTAAAATSPQENRTAVTPETREDDTSNGHPTTHRPRRQWPRRQAPPKQTRPRPTIPPRTPLSEQRQPPVQTRRRPRHQPRWLPQSTWVHLERQRTRRLSPRATRLCPKPRRLWPRTTKRLRPARPRMPHP